MDTTVTIELAAVARELNLPEPRVRRTVELLDDGNTVPFVTRYRKDQTGGLDEEQIRQVQDHVTRLRMLAERKRTILKSIQSQGKLTDELAAKIRDAATTKRLEDLYLPFKPKKQTLATAARDRGLEPLAREVMRAETIADDLDLRALDFIDIDKGVRSQADALLGVGHLIAESFSERADLREALRRIVRRTGRLVCQKIETAEDEEETPAKEKPAKEKPSTKKSRRADDATASQPSGDPPAPTAGDKQTTAADSPAAEITEQPSGVAESAATDEAIRSADEEAIRSADEAVAESPAAAPAEVADTPAAADPADADATAETPSPSSSGDESDTAGQSAPPAANVAATAEPLPEEQQAAEVAASTAAGDEAAQPADEATAAKEAAEKEKQAAADKKKQEAEARQQARQQRKARKEEEKKRKRKKKEAAYKDYFHFEESISRLPSHRVLAINRGERGRVLRVKLEADFDAMRAEAEQLLVPPDHPHGEFLRGCLKDALARLVYPALEREVRRELTDKAEDHAVQVFARNLRKLLLTPPISGHRVLAVDPGFKSGCKLAALDEFGEVHGHGTIYLVGSDERKARSRARLVDMLRVHKISVVAIGNGTACRETERLVSQVLADELKDQSLAYVIVNEAGASVYSTSQLGREELPQYDASQRSAVSIGRRLLDPLSELVKINPANIGVGLYQHDMKAKHLQSSLDAVVESGVNYVGVDLNTASPALLRYASGLNQLTARRLYEYRKQHGPFTRREQLKDVPGFGEATFIQSAGFLKIAGGDNPLDATWIHPESYDAARRILEKLGASIEDLARQIKATQGRTTRSGAAPNGESHAAPEATQAEPEPAFEGPPPPIAPVAELETDEVAPAAELTTPPIAAEEVAAPSSAQDATDAIASADSPPATAAEESHVGDPAPVDHAAIDTAAADNAATDSAATDDPVSSSSENPPPDAQAGDAPRVNRSLESSTAAVAPLTATAATMQKPSAAASSEAPEENGDSAAWPALVQQAAKVDVAALATELGIGELLCRDILHSLTRPGRDPREDLPPPIFRREILKLEDLKPGMELTGTVLNVVDFGAFVDIGLHDTGLVHISRLADRYIKDPHEVVGVGDVVTVWVVEIDKQRRRVSLTAIEPGTEKPAKEKEKRPPRQRKTSDRPPRGRGQKGGRRSRDEKKPSHSKPFTTRSKAPAKPITKGMKEGREPLRTFGDLKQFFELKDDGEKKEENEKGKGEDGEQ